jgi:hypothetical protein
MKTNLVIIFGPPAVGKMAVGRALAKLTGYKLLHNHISIEVTREFFDFKHLRFLKLSDKIRMAILREVAKSHLPGLIFTFVWAHGLKAEERYADRIIRIFKKEGGRVYFVELVADFGTRLKRNITAYRLSQKASKRNIRKSKKNMLELENKYRLSTRAGEFKRRPYIKIDNTKLSAKKVAVKIKRKFKL